MRTALPLAVLRSRHAVTALVGCAAILAASGTALGQIRVNPTGVNVNAQGATTVFLTFGGLRDQLPVEALWCGALVPAAPDIGLACDPATIFGSLPLRFDLSRTSGSTGFTDIMSIPPSVSRRAYQAAEAGERSGFFYVRRFVSTAGGRDEYVAVTCRLAGGGARTPLSLTDVRLAFAVDDPVLFLDRGVVAPKLAAAITYTGTGRLRGRWEIVRPGEDPPGDADLLTEASLPLEQRPFQRRYTEVGRFNEFLPPSGHAILAGPDARRLPTEVEGMYLVLLRIEASDDKEADSNLQSAGAGRGIVHSGAVAGFPMPVLRYVVGGRPTAGAAQSGDDLQLLEPADGHVIAAAAALTFAWRDVRQAAFYRLEIQSIAGADVLTALAPGHAGAYRAPSWLADALPDGRLRWRVAAFDASGRLLRATDWRTAQIDKGQGS